MLPEVEPPKEDDDMVSEVSTISTTGIISDNDENEVPKKGRNILRLLGAPNPANNVPGSGGRDVVMPLKVDEEVEPPKEDDDMVSAVNKISTTGIISDNDEKEVPKKGRNNMPELICKPEMKFRENDKEKNDNDEERMMMRHDDGVPIKGLEARAGINKKRYSQRSIKDMISILETGKGDSKEKEVTIRKEDKSGIRNIHDRTPSRKRKEDEQETPNSKRKKETKTETRTRKEVGKVQGGMEGTNDLRRQTTKNKNNEGSNVSKLAKRWEKNTNNGDLSKGRAQQGFDFFKLKKWDLIKGHQQTNPDAQGDLEKRRYSHGETKMTGTENNGMREPEKLTRENTISMKSQH